MSDRKTSDLIRIEVRCAAAQMDFDTMDLGIQKLQEVEYEEYLRDGLLSSAGLPQPRAEWGQELTLVDRIRRD